ncbi:60fabefd-61c8-48cc-9961-1c4d8f906d6d [Sclerotinia trifoliorum]|uniref:60fabefd-61c8-48cc-9961-1c4d8f906d6d n=1 Tax=Sclerotinia trifoliorum TaxID=28548 RepID=A0A8H2ZJU5_9HELO|nr:60fabefd-61c8-48cc-9961-1c4d8f906d6d [Sclerotinia trifoliorum]
MRMFRLPCWIAESRGCDQVLDGERKHIMANTRLYECPSPTKRKRSSSPNVPMPVLNTPTVQEVKRRKREMSEEGCHSPKTKEDVEVTDRKEQIVDLALVRETIDSELSLEILMKHNELRLIETELAKCQVSLEQLRRVHLIPFPGVQSTGAQVSSESMVNVSAGTGPAVWSGDKVPKWAPPYGITEGPYTRHWAKWLIPDPAFDGIDVVDSRVSPGRPRAGKMVPEGRATRNSIADGGNFSTKSRSHRGSGQSLQSLPSGHTQQKKAGPSILKRSDGKTVKLVCLDCNREDFSSTQGFINHCRIAHHREFKSHEEAAQTSGQIIEVDEVGATPVLEKSPSVATGDLVHPLIKSAPVDQEAYTALLSRIDDSMNLYLQGRLPGVTSIPGSANSSPQKQVDVKPKVQPSNQKFVPSTATPHLSELLKSRGFGGDLDEIVGDAITRVTMDEASSSDEESSDDEVIETPTAIPSRRPGGFDGSVDTPMTGMRLPARATMSPAHFGRPTSSKGIDASARSGLAHISPHLSYATLNTSMAAPEIRHNRPQPINTRNHDHDGDIDMAMVIPDASSIIDLSPNTVVSNNAPSLVSDDGEYDEGDDDADSVSSEDADEGSDVAEIDIEDGDGEKVVGRSVLGRSQDRSSKKDDKHVTFVREVPGDTNSNNAANKKARQRQ